MKNNNGARSLPNKRSKFGTVLMVATGVSIGVAVSFFVIVGKGVKNCLQTIDGLKDGHQD